MGLPRGSKRAAQTFAKAMIRGTWDEVVPLLSADLAGRSTPESLAAELGWEQLGARLRREWIESTGESEDIVPDLDPPKRYEVFEVDDREPPEGLPEGVDHGWIEVDLQPDEDSEFDVCCNVFLAIIDENGPKIAAYAVENVFG